MSDASASHLNRPGRYEVRIKGHLSSRWALWFDGMTLTTEGDGTTCLEGPRCGPSRPARPAEQAARHRPAAALGSAGRPHPGDVAATKPRQHPARRLT